MQEIDIVIVGSGPAGLTAAIYCGRSKLNTLCLEKVASGGQLLSTEDVENFPGFSSISGVKLTERIEEQALKFGAVSMQATVSNISLRDNYRIVHTNKGDFKCKAIILATGAKPKIIGFPGELEFRGKGVSYCAVCDAAFYDDADNVIVVGGGDSAVEEAIYLTKFANKVTLIHRRNSLRATKILQDRLMSNTKIEVLWNCVIDSINGKDLVDSITVRNLITNEVKKLICDGVFVYLGMTPLTEFARDLVKTDANGYIYTNDEMKTNISGIFAAGDNRVKGLRQIVTAASDGAIAAYYAAKYIEDGFVHR